MKYKCAGYYQIASGISQNWKVVECNKKNNCNNHIRHKEHGKNPNGEFFQALCVEHCMQSNYQSYEKAENETRTKTA